MTHSQTLARELGSSEANITRTIALFDEGATVPFIARYRKEMTGGLDDTQLRTLEQRLTYLRELDARRETVLKSIEAQGKLDDTLREKILAVDNKTALEDLYLPYKPKRRNKAQTAREQGLQPLADALLRDQPKDPATLTSGFFNEHVPDADAALAGARAILIEQFGESAELTAELRERLWQIGEIRTTVAAGKEKEGEKFKDYFDYHEAIARIPGHRALAVFRGRNEGTLTLQLRYQSEDIPTTQVSEFEQRIADHFNITPACQWLNDTVRLAWRGKLFPSLELDALQRLKTQADQDAITVFARNLQDLLLAAPAGRLVTLGMDPGFRNGVKCAVIDDTGKLLDTFVLYPHPPQKQWQAALVRLAEVVTRHNIQLIAIGNGTASRETDELVRELVRTLPKNNLQHLVVSEAGASVYSASELAAREFPDLDVSLRGAVSIARRLQDPLAELVKIDPKSIGVGQYQHDVNQNQLAQSLDHVVEDCVNAVGVDVNTASAALLSRIAGLNATLAENIVHYRDENGAYRNRKQLLKVPRLGAKTFEQAAGFLRVLGGNEPLDASAVHPEAYPLVATMLSDLKLSADRIIGQHDVIAKIQPHRYISEQFGLPTLRDILSELEKPGRDPRGEFQTANFNERISKISDLEVGMVLEGVVSNVANFGAFVDIGVHQDGLVHISQLADRYVSDPREIVKAGDVVKVTVLEIDVPRKRISLSMRSPEKKPVNSPSAKTREKPQKASDTSPKTIMADAFGRLKRR